MKKKIFWFLTILVGTTVGYLLAIFMMRGIPLLGLPDSRHIVKAEILDTRLDEEPVLVTDPDKIEVARNCVNTLFWQPGSVSDQEKDSIITITFEDDKGKKTSISANEKTVWYQGKARKIRHAETFIKAVEAIFFHQ